MSYISHVLATRPASLLAYWPLNETSGGTADNAEGTAERDGSYLNVVLNSGIAPDGNPASEFNGSNSRVNIYSASLSGVFDPNAGSISTWIRITDSGVWSDGIYRKVIRIGADASNIIEIMRYGGVANAVFGQRRANGNAVFQDWNSGGSLDWFHVVITWDKTADEFKVYINGTQTGSTQNSLDTWTGSLSSDITLLGADTWSGGLSVWDGFISHFAIWNAVLTPSEIAQLYIGMSDTTQDSSSNDSTESGGVTTTTTTYTRKYIHTIADYKTVVVLE